MTQPPFVPRDENAPHVLWAKHAVPNQVEKGLIGYLKEITDKDSRYELLKILCDRANSERTGELAKALSIVARNMHELE